MKSELSSGDSFRDLWLKFVFEYEENVLKKQILLTLPDHLCEFLKKTVFLIFTSTLLCVAYLDIGRPHRKNPQLIFHFVYIYIFTELMTEILKRLQPLCHLDRVHYGD